MRIIAIYFWWEIETISMQRWAATGEMEMTKVRADKGF
jgi:hypothetical protein